MTVPHIDESSLRKPKLSMSLNKLVVLVCLLGIAYFGYDRFTLHQTEQQETAVYILEPQFNDIYFLDLRLLNGNSELKNKYQLAKVVRVSEDNVAIVYGKFFYKWQYSATNSIRYGDLSNNSYFTLIPDYIPLNKIKEMQNNGSIYLVKRPVGNKLYGHFVSN